MRKPRVVWSTESYNKLLKAHKLKCETFITTNVLIPHTCSICNNTFDRLPSTVIRGRASCPFCTKSPSSRNLTSYNEELRKFKVKASSYINTATSAEHECLKCNAIFLRKPLAFITERSVNCPACSSKVTTRTLKSHNIEIADLGIRCTDFQKGRVHNTYKCKVCKRSFKKITQALLSGRSLDCEYCKKDSVREEYISLLSSLNIECTNYLHISKPANHHCLTCDHHWKAQPRAIRDLGTGCPGSCASDKRLKSSFNRKEIEINGRNVTVQGFEPSALRWLETKGCNMDKIAVLAKEGKPTISYKYKAQPKLYIPDFYHTSKNRIIEVKSIWTLLGRSSDTFLRNCAKAKATIEQGYDFILMVMAKDGRRLRVPKNWFELSALKLRTKIGALNEFS